jgi:hypothetical protein
MSRRGFPKRTNVRPAHLSGSGFLMLSANQNCGVLREGLGGCLDNDPGQRNLHGQYCPLASCASESKCCPERKGALSHAGNAKPTKDIKKK